MLFIFQCVEMIHCIFWGASVNKVYFYNIFIFFLRIYLDTYKGR